MKQNKIAWNKKVRFFLMFLIIATVISCILTSCDSAEEPHSCSYNVEYFWDDTYHWLKCLDETCNKEAQKTEHTFENNTCNVCQYNKSGHICEWSYWTPNNDGTHSRVCKVAVLHIETSFCFGGTSSCGTPAECEVCNGYYGDYTPHSFVLEIAEPQFLISEANCFWGALYAKSCACGEVGGETFAVGDPLGCVYSNWAPIGNGEHRGICERDNSHQCTIGCSGGEWGCTELPICSSCGSGYGELQPHDYVKSIPTGDYLKSEATCTQKAEYYFSCKCGKAGSESFVYGEYASHKYDKAVADYQYISKGATCTSQATYFYSCVCGACGSLTFEFGDYEEHFYWKSIVSDKYLASPADCTQKAQYYYSCHCGATGTKKFEHGEKLPHTIQSVAASEYLKEAATCTKKAVYYESCSECKSALQTTFEHGMVKSHVFDQCIQDIEHLKSEASCTSKAIYYKSCSCGTLGTETYEYGEQLAHTLSAWKGNGFGIHYKSCENGCSYVETGVCEGGIANCTEGKVCNVCSKEYTEPLGHNYANNYLDSKICTVCYRLKPSEGLLFENTTSWDDEGNSYDGVAVIGIGTCDDRYVVIPNEYNGKPITAVKLENASNMMCIYLPESLRTISFGAFFGCDSLQSIVLPKNVRRIDQSAFYGCESLTSVTAIGEITSIGMWAFYGCTSLKEVSMEKTSIDTIRLATFEGCASLASFVIPETVTKIERYAFAGCSSLSSIVIPDGVISIGDMENSGGAFENCTSLRNVTLSSNLEMIGTRTFYGCRSIRQIKVPESLTTIGKNAFFGCMGLVEIINKSQTTFIAGSEDNGYIARYALKVHTGEVFYAGEIENYLFLVEGNVKYLVGYTGNSPIITLPSVYGEYVIWKYAFNNLDFLTSIEIPFAVIGIESNAFSGCHKLVEIINRSSVEIGYAGKAADCYISSAIIVHTGTRKVSIDSDGYIFYRDGNLQYLLGFVERDFSSTEDMGDVLVLPDNGNVNYRIYNGALDDSEAHTVFVPRSMVWIECGGLNTDNIEQIYYLGTEDDWNKIYDPHSCLSEATVYFYSSTQPTESGNYWHYTSGGYPTPWL